MTRLHFDEELKNLKDDLLKMAGKVEQAIDKAINALKDKNEDLAKEVFEGDDVIDEMERQIEEKCIMLIATQQPLAKDLRIITTALKIITDLERIADHASDISQITIRMIDKPYIKPLIDIPEMAKIAKHMVNSSIDSYLLQDKDIALQVCIRDDEVDKLFYKILLELQYLMKHDSNCVEQGINFLLIAKYLERIADHATNICEWVNYIITGEHKKLIHYKGPQVVTNPFEKHGLLDADLEMSIKDKIDNFKKDE